MAVGNLELITSVTTTVTNLLNVTNVFTSKYDVYKIVISGLNQDTNVANEINGIRLIDSGGSVISDSEYDYAVLGMNSGSSFDETRSTSAGNIFMGQRADRVGDGSNNTVFYVFNPFDSSSYTFTLSQSASADSAFGLIGAKGIGVHKSAEQITGFQIYDSDVARPFESGSKISVYGLASN